MILRVVSFCFSSVGRLAFLSLARLGGSCFPLEVRQLLKILLATALRCSIPIFSSGAIRLLLIGSSFDEGGGRVGSCSQMRIVGKAVGTWAFDPTTFQSRPSEARRRVKTVQVEVSSHDRMGMRSGRSEIESGPCHTQFDQAGLVTAFATEHLKMWKLCGNAASRPRRLAHGLEVRNVRRENDGEF